MMMISIRGYKDEDEAYIEYWEQQREIFSYLCHTKPRCFRQGTPLDESSTKWYIIEVENVSIGSVWIEEMAAGKGKLGIWIGDPTRRNMGIGKQVVKQMIDWAFTVWGLEEIYLRVRQNNRRAIQCYKKCGFVLVKEYPKMRFADGSYQGIYEMTLYRNGISEKVCGDKV